MRITAFLLLAIVLHACTAKSQNKLTAHSWKVEQAIFETKDSFFLKFKKQEEASLEKMQYAFKDDGTFTVNNGERSMTGRWNFAKDDTAMLYRNIGKTKEILVMRYAPMAEEIWLPWEGQTSIFRDYLGEDGIYAIKSPVDENSIVRLILRENK